MVPFGGSSLLTVDLGQQYIDFSSYFRRAILHDPSSIVYSFSNGLGGGMIGIWSYYLLSPLNWLLLFFPGTHITSGIMLLTLLKYGLASLSFSWLIKKNSQISGVLIVLFSISYALMGWTIANQLNIMWLDILFLLPLILNGLIKILNGGKRGSYIVWLTLAFISNYYMGYMVSLFIILMFCFLVTDGFVNWKKVRIQSYSFVTSSLISGLLASFILLPTFVSLLQSKAQYTVTTFKWKFDYFPLDSLAKFFVGTFNFSQMPTGMANLFVGSLPVLGSLLYFFDRRFSTRGRIVAGMITLVLFLSLCFQPLDLLWHAGQYPVWYPYRFSFVVGFWLLWLASRVFTNEFRLTKRSFFGVGVILIACCAYIGIRLKRFDNFLTITNYGIGVIFLVAFVVILFFYTRYKKMCTILLCVLVVLELSTNVFLSLKNISYVSQSDYGNYTRELQRLVNQIKSKDSGFYRIGKNFLRTKDDPFQTGFNGGSVFSSTLEKNTASFMKNIGTPSGSGFIEYSNGTLVTDSLLGMKYYFGKDQTLGVQNNKNILQASSARSDLSNYKEISHDQQATVLYNKNYLPIGYAASAQALTVNSKEKNPAQYQSNIIAGLTGKKDYKRLFHAESFSSTSFQNTNIPWKINNAKLRKIDKSKSAFFHLFIKLKTNDSYYLRLDSTLDAKNVKIILNGQELQQSRPYNGSVLTNIANHNKGQTLDLELQMNKDSLDLKDFQIYRLNGSKLSKAIKGLKQGQLKLTHHTARSFDGVVNNTKDGRILNTSIPYSRGWHVSVNGNSVKTYKVFNTFMAIKLPKGVSRISIAYWPPLLNLGIAISILTLVVIFTFTNRRFLLRLIRGNKK